MRVLLAVVLIAVTGPYELGAQIEEVPGAELAKGSTCIVRIPGSFLKSKLSFMGATRWTATVAASATGDLGAIVNGDPRWQTAGFPSLQSVDVDSIKRDSDKKAEVRLRDKEKVLDVRLTLEGGDLKKLFAAACASPASIGPYKDSIYLQLATKFFGDTPLAKLSDARKVALAAYAHATARGTTLGGETYKDNLYLVVDLGLYGSEYNSLRLNQQQRIARVINESMLVALKAFASVVADHQDVYGVKFMVGIGHRPFTQTTGTEIDALEVFVPAAEIKRFADADITSQALIDKSVLIVNRNRIEVRLSDS